MACILVITEDMEKRRAWRQLFVHAGYAVMDARDGREGMHYIQTHIIDLVVLDVPLPQGIATLRAFRLVAPAMRLLVLVDHDGARPDRWGTYGTAQRRGSGLAAACGACRPAGRDARAPGDAVNRGVRDRLLQRVGRRRYVVA